MTIPFTDDEITAEKGSCNENREHESTNIVINTEVKVDLSKNLEETTYYHETCFSLHDSKFLDICLKPIIYFMKIILSLTNSIQYLCKELETDHWYRKVRKKLPVGHVADWNSKSNEWIFTNIVKPFRHIPRYIYSAYPFFPYKYDSFVKDDKRKQKLEIMKFEAARLSTFSTFPTSAGVFATRLASAGFYYSGQGDEVICFNCGIKYANWQKQDLPMDIHRKMSAQCSFVLEKMNEGNKETDNGLDLAHQMTSTNNKPDLVHQMTSTNNRPDLVHQVTGTCYRPDLVPQVTGTCDRPDLVYQVTGTCDRPNLVYQVTGACGNMSDIIHSNNNQCHNGTESSQNTDITSLSGAGLAASTYTSPSNNTLISRSSNDVNSLIRIPNSNRTTHQSANDHNQTTNEASSPNGTMGMGVCTVKPKYPRYAIRSVRLDSFKTWPRHVTQSPEELACAGFFFTGIEDHCRCFYCGGGLKHWEPEDQPWIEHARWYQHCPFVRQCKGDKFIEDVTSGRQIQNISTSQNQENSQQTITRTSNSTQNDFLNHPAVQLVSEFGYEPNTMQTAYNFLVKSGSTDITATSLMERIFMQEETTNGNPVKDQSQQSTTQSSHKNEPIESSSQLEPVNDPELELSIKSLEEENQNLRDQQTCKICLDEPVAIVFLPCGHMAACLNCAPALIRCPICRAFIKGTVKAIMC